MTFYRKTFRAPDYIEPEELDNWFNAAITKWMNTSSTNEPRPDARGIQKIEYVNEHRTVVFYKPQRTNYEKDFTPPKAQPVSGAKQEASSSNSKQSDVSGAPKGSTSLAGKSK